MFDVSDPRRFRRTVAGLCMVVAPALLLIDAVVRPDSEFVFLAALVFAVPAVLGIVHMLSEREVAAGHVGGALALAGIVGLAMYAGGPAERWELAATAAGIGAVILAMGLYRAHAVPMFAAGGYAVGAALMAVAAYGDGTTTPIVGAALTLIGLGSIGRAVLAESDAAWEHTPEVPPFGRTAAGTR